MGESRQELLNWLNDLLQINVTKVEQLGTGAAFCQIFDSIYHDVPMHRVKFNARTEYEYLNNFKILTGEFTLHQIDRTIQVERLVKCKMQDNLEFFQWCKRYWDQHYPGGNYDAAGRRKGQVPTAPPAHKSTVGVAAATAPKRGTTPTVGGARTRTPMGGGGANTAALQNEIYTLKESVLGLERERDFYFSKLRDIELLLQKAVEEQPEQEEDGLVKSIHAILYSTEEGFEIPDAAAADDNETF